MNQSLTRSGSYLDWLARLAGFRYSTISGNLTMVLAFARISISTRRKLTSILLAVAIFALLAGLATLA